MATSTKNRPAATPGFPTGGPTLTERLRELSADMAAVIKSGNEAEVLKVRTRIVNLRKEVAKLTGAFDKALETAQNGYNGEDYLSNVKTVIKRGGRGRAKTVRVESPEEFF